MALASTQLPEPPAARVVAIAGRFAQSPSRAPKSVAVHFLHGQVDTVIPHVHSVMGAERWVALGGKATLDLFPFAGHGIEPEMAARVVERLRSGVPG
jgi:phospholipase/carboxylesterase